MPTDNLFAYLTNKKLIPYDVMQTYIFDYMKAALEAYMSKMYRAPGVYDAEATVTGTATGEVSVAGAFEGTDGDGHQFSFGAADPRFDDVPFENANGISYHMGIRQVELVEELDINTRIGQPEYRSNKENIGTIGTPDAVVDNGSTITLTVDAVTESGYSHANRTVRVYLVTPKGVSWANAYEDRPVVWDSSNNKITTTGLLGQASGSVSTTPADYVVCEIGPIIVRQATADLRSTSGVLFLAQFNGNSGGSPSPSMVDQPILTGDLTDLADITRYCAHSDLKVSVRADASDSGEDQVRVESSGGSRMWGVDEAAKHWLPNAGSSVPLDDASEYGKDGLDWNSGSVTGILNQAMDATHTALGPFVISGLNYNGSGGANELDVAAGQAWLPEPAGTGGGIKFVAANLTGLPSSGAVYVYLDPTQTTPQWSATKANAYTSGAIPLFVVTMTAGTPALTADLRYRMGHVQKKGVVTVGDDFPASNFANLQAAFDYLDYMWDQAQDENPSIELWIVGDIYVGSDQVSTGTNVDGLVVRGMNHRGDLNGRASIYYDESTTNKNCILIESNNIEWHNIHFESRSTATAGSSVAQGAMAISSGSFIGCRFDSTNGYFKAVVLGRSARDWSDLKFENCVIEIGDALSSNFLAQYAGENWLFRDCILTADATQKCDFFDLADDGQKCRFIRCSFAYFADQVSDWSASGTGSANTLVDCDGDIEKIGSAIMRGCRFTGIKLWPTSANEEIIANDCYFSGDDIIKNDYDVKIQLTGCKIVPGYTAGSDYLIGGTNRDNISLINCDCSEYGNVLDTAIPIKLEAHCRLINSKFGPYRTATNQGVAFIEIDGDSTHIIGCEIDASYYCECINVITNSAYIVIENNDITNPTDYTTGTTAIGVSSASNDGVIIKGNHIHNIGDTTDGGLGLYTVGDYTVIKGNHFQNIKGAAVHIAGGSLGNVIQGNIIFTVGLAVVTNPKTSAVSAHGIHCYGDRNVINGNMISLPVDDGIHLGSGADNCAIVGNTEGGAGGDGIELVAGTNNNTIIGNNTQNGVVDGGTGNVIGGADTNI